MPRTIRLAPRFPANWLWAGRRALLTLAIPAAPAPILLYLQLFPAASSVLPKLVPARSFFRALIRIPGQRPLAPAYWTFKMEAVWELLSPAPQFQAVQRCS